jgi:hypothetical protein
MSASRIYSRRWKCPECAGKWRYTKSLKCVACVIKLRNDKFRAAIAGQSYSMERIQDTRCQEFKAKELLIMRGVNYA